MDDAQKKGLARLREPFTGQQVGKLPKPYNSNAQKGQCRECGGYHGLPAVHLDYVGHAALTDRLLEVDPEWTWEPLSIGPDGLPVFDKDGGLWIKLTVLGVTRLGYGDAQGKRGGNAVKEAIGDALRNGGMRFGAALDLWHKGELHEAEEERGRQPEPQPEQKTVTRQRKAPEPENPKKRDYLAEIPDAGGDPDLLRALWHAAKADGEPKEVLDKIFAAASSGNAAA